MFISTCKLILKDGEGFKLKRMLQIDNLTFKIQDKNYGIAMEVIKNFFKI